MEKSLETIRRLISDRIPFNIITIEDESLVRRLFGIPGEVTFKTAYEPDTLNVLLRITKEDIKKLLKDREGLEEVLLKHEHNVFSEINVLSQQKKLFQSFDDPTKTTPAEYKALNGETGLPGTLLRENLKMEGKIPATRAIRISGKYKEKHEEKYKQEIEPEDEEYESTEEE